MCNIIDKSAKFRVCSEHFKEMDFIKSKYFVNVDRNKKLLIRSVNRRNLKGAHCDRETAK